MKSATITLTRDRAGLGWWTEALGTGTLNKEPVWIEFERFWRPTKASAIGTVVSAIQSRLDDQAGTISVEVKSR